MPFSRRSFHISMALAASSFALPRPARAEHERAKVVVIQPYGTALSAKDVAAVSAAITAFFAVKVRVQPRRPHPKDAWYRPRKRWRADQLLTDLAATKPPDAHRIIGLTKADISVTNGPHKDWGVLGYGMIAGPACVVSRYRCRSGAKSAAHIRQRLAKVCLHELGHTLGSDHCPDQTCLMADARGKVSTIDAEHTFCARTQALFEREGTPMRDGAHPL